MANKVLDLLLQLTVKGTDQAVALENAIEAIAEEMKGLKGSKSLDDILGVVGTEQRVKQLTSAVKTLFAAGKLGFDLDLSKPFIKAGESVDSLKVKLRAVAADARDLFELGQAKEAARLTAAWTAELERLREKAAGSAQALEKTAQAAKALDVKEKAAQTARWTAELEKLREAAAGAALKLTQIRTNTLERLREAAAAAKPPLDALERQVEKLRAALAAGKEIKFDLDVTKSISDLQRLEFQLKEIKDKFLAKGQELRINTSTAKKDIADVIQSLLATQRRLQDLSKNSVRLNINSKDAITLREALESVNTQLALAQQRARQFAATGNVFQQFAQQARDAGVATHNLRSEVGTLTRDFLFLRRAIYGLGFSFVARELLQVAIQFDNMRQALSAVFGTMENSNREFKFLVDTADRLGLNITSLTDRYNKLSIAGREAGLSQAIIKDNFLAIAEAGARLHLSVEQVDGALLALEQIASKGKVSMEELRRQLGNALPGAMSIAAKALDITTEKLFELVENGQLASNIFLKVFPAAIRAAFSVDTTTRIDTTQAAINRFTNALKTLVDQVLRAGALDAFTDILTGITKALKDPEVIKGFNALSAGFKTLVEVVTQNIRIARDLLIAYAAFKGLSFIIGLVRSIGVAFGALVLAGKAARMAAIDFDVTTGAATKAQGAIGRLTTGFRRFAAIAMNPIVITLAFVGVELFYAYLKNLELANEKTLELADAQRQLESDDRMVIHFLNKAKALEEFSDAAVLSAKEIKSLAVETLPLFQKQIEGTIAFLKAEAVLVEKQLKSRESELALLKKKGVLSALDLAQQELAKAAIEGLTEKRALLIGKEAIYTDQLLKIANAQGGVFVSTEHLNGAIQSQIALFDQAIKGGKGVRESLEKAIPDSFALGGVKAISDVALTMERLQQQASVTGKVIEEELAKKLNNLNGTELQAFIRNATKGWKDLTISAEGLALVLNGAVRAALKNIGEELETVGTGVSKTFLDMAQNFKALAESGKLTGEQLAGALNKVTEAAKTTAEVSFLKAIITVTGVEAKNMGAAISDALQKLADKSREVAGVLDTSLGDAFRRLGIQTQQQISSALAQMIIDFKRVATEGKAAATSIADGFIKVRDAVLAAGGSNAQLIESALLARTKVQELFDAGKLNAVQFIEEMGKVKIATANTFSDPLNVAGMAFRAFGIKTRAELYAVAQAAQEAFNFAAASGQFSAQELGKAAADVEAKWVAAFGAIQQAAETAFSNVSQMGMYRRDFPALSPQEIRRLSNEDLEKGISDLDAQRAYQMRPGSFYDPVYVGTLIAAMKALIAELARRGTTSTYDKSPGRQERYVFSPTFNFSNSTITPKQVTEQIIPVIDDYARRRG